jgi:hypothetical protein
MMRTQRRHGSMMELRPDIASRRSLHRSKDGRMRHLWLCPLALLALLAVSTVVIAEGDARHPVPDTVIEEQRAALSAARSDAGPQSPRDLTSQAGANARVFGSAPAFTLMNLCNIHFHENAEHRGGEFTTYAGNGDGHGYGTGYRYDGTLSEAELAPLAEAIGESEHGDLQSGDTIEIHFVFSSADVTPGPTLNACLDDGIANPQLRVETVVAVLVNDVDAADFVALTTLAVMNGYHQAPNLPSDLGDAITYAGSTTGPSYNETPSHLQVTWSVRPRVLKIDIHSLAAWLAANPFEEDHAHGVRNLVLDVALLSPIR